MKRIRLVPALLAVLAACDGSPTESADAVVVETDFQDGTPAGWVGGFADYPVGDEANFDLAFEVRSLPPPLDTGRRAIYLAGSNRSDDLFMFVKRPVDGLRPGAVYRVRFEVEIASNEGSGCAGIGGAPGESVTLKAGATSLEPGRVVENGYYRMSVDKGDQTGGGRDAIVLGHIANGSSECSNGAYRLKRFDDPAFTVDAAADAGGRLWLLVGTDSGYEGTTRLFYTRILTILTPR